jgi:hypothetical protein
MGGGHAPCREQQHGCAFIFESNRMQQARVRSGVGGVVGGLLALLNFCARINSPLWKLGLLAGWGQLVFLSPMPTYVVPPPLVLTIATMLTQRTVVHSYMCVYLCRHDTVRNMPLNMRFHHHHEAVKKHCAIRQSSLLPNLHSLNAEVSPNCVPATHLLKVMMPMHCPPAGC